MTDLEQRIFNFAKKPQLANFATIIDDTKPRVRYVVGKLDELLTFRFSTHLDSNKVEQISKNSNVFVTLGANSVMATNWLQIEGTGTVTTATDERKSFWFAPLENYFKGIDDPRYSVVIVKPLQIQLNTMGKPSEIWRQHSE